MVAVKSLTLCSVASMARSAGEKGFDARRVRALVVVDVVHRDIATEIAGTVALLEAVEVLPYVFHNA